MSCKLADSRKRNHEVEGFVEIIGSTSDVSDAKQKFRARRSSSAGWDYVRAFIKRVHKAIGASRQQNLQRTSLNDYCQVCERMQTISNVKNRFKKSIERV